MKSFLWAGPVLITFGFDVGKTEKIIEEAYKWIETWIKAFIIYIGNQDFVCVKTQFDASMISKELAFYCMTFTTIFISSRSNKHRVLTNISSINITRCHHLKDLLRHRDTRQKSLASYTAIYQWIEKLCFFFIRMRIFFYSFNIRSQRIKSLIFIFIAGLVFKHGIAAYFKILNFDFEHACIDQ